VTPVIVIDAFYAVAFLLLGFVIWRGNRKYRRGQAYLISGATRATRDHDLCELLYAMPAYGETNDLDLDTDRLWAAIRDEQQKGDQA
jgi:hypothetical protein